MYVSHIAVTGYGTHLLSTEITCIVLSIPIDLLIDFNGMSICQGYSMFRYKEITNIVHLYLHFLYSCFIRGFFFAHSYIAKILFEYK